MKVTTGHTKNAQQNILSLGDAHSQIRAITEAKFRHVMLDFVEGLFFSEVEKLCGKAFARKTDEFCHRGGSDPGSVILQGKRISVKKPRVKLAGEEVELKSYAALQSYDLLCERVMKHMLAGVSTRNYEPLLDEVSGSMGLSKSSVSNAFGQGSLQALEELNSRNLSEHRFCVLMMDGIHYSDKMIIVALGITAEGKKLILGLKEGHTENFEICKDLLHSLSSKCCIWQGRGRTALQLA